MKPAKSESPPQGVRLRRYFRFSGPRTMRRLQMGLVIGALVGLIVAATIGLGALSQFEPRFADLFYRPLEASGRVVLVAIDDKTVEQYGWPIERLTHSGFLVALLRSQPKVIALDFILPDPTGDVQDDLLAQVIIRAPRIIQPVLGVEVTRYPASPGQFPAFDSLLRPAAPLRTSNTVFGHAMIYPDSDGGTRRVPLAIDAPGERIPALGLAAYDLYQGLEPTVSVTSTEIVVGGKLVPLDDNGQAMVQYVPRGRIKTVSYSDVAQGKVDYTQFRDNIVLVGPVAQTVRESYAVPLTIDSTRAANVEIQADLLETFLSGSLLRLEDRLALAVGVLIVALVAGATLTHVSWPYAVPLTLFYLVAYLLYGFQRSDGGVMVTPLYVVLTLILTLGVTMLYRYLTEERSHALLARVFVGMVPPTAFNRVVALYDRGALSLTGGRREVTVLCAGLRELAGLSDAMAPEALISLFNQYAARIMDAVFTWEGSVNRVGNNLIAVWNMPLDQPDHAHRALNAAFEVQREVELLRQSESEERSVGTSIGIATGTAVAGHLGASARADYTVIGEVVTLAERLSALASDNQVLIDPPTFEQVGSKFETYQVHTLRVRGRKDPLIVREVKAKPELQESP